MGEDRAKEAYTPETWNRLVEVKNRWDPNNLFRLNQNIKPIPEQEAQPLLKRSSVK
jgi:FAD/FMN-containing dehydrogenase